MLLWILTSSLWALCVPSAASVTCELSSVLIWVSRCSSTLLHSQARLPEGLAFSFVISAVPNVRDSAIYGEVKEAE